MDGVCGHPEIETALVELYREGGEWSYLETAQFFVERRGHGTARSGPLRGPLLAGPPARSGRQRRLRATGSVSSTCWPGSSTSTPSPATSRCWRPRSGSWWEMVATKTYLTGGVGAHHQDESFGDPYELPNKRSYCETCAAIASVMGCLAVADDHRGVEVRRPDRAHPVRRLPGRAVAGRPEYIYADPLQVREGHLAGGNDSDCSRKPWFHCACCPPNVMRTLASLGQLRADRRRQ